VVKYVVTAIEVHPEILFSEGGDVRFWMGRLAQEMSAAVKAKAPPGRSRSIWQRTSTGRLRASVNARLARTGPVQNMVTVEVGRGLDYAVHVLGGTAFQGKRFIYTTRGYAHKAEVDFHAQRQRRGGHVAAETKGKGWYLKLPANGVGSDRRFHLRVKGQRANNFLFDGYNEVARLHEALDTFKNPYAF
jgi:hypothetical protein